ncbi:Armadillo/beta-catenin-like repeat family protein [Trichomonas vaginalis G3]|uniref:Armadillo/beta-catenin-like repeat family protein n=1 Tax=Trichomonas vaginalis (strain ATCC PRA-98 / G3) TaxID=412133 RepID=A2ERL1_TRIV3|nr:sperm-associated antigen 6 family [Trichomonas vaginalis G3]EAY04738.1 Armadillo/beta-catenin-like repeat family protein [Trichomonas vaginalis G3]KAI5526846.1 sperm-associated antigen 6 family [Trichomonas vaginalis G3]|eukprot:XP_001316961.1 Armadillo/beta-catenin-like repeat family protein [Trichomonas vaginalis G3]
MSKQQKNEFETYKNARREFVRYVAEEASRPANIPSLIERDVLSLLRPLLLDNYSAIQQTAALAIGRLANGSEQIATKVVDAGILPEIVTGLSSQDKYIMQNSCFVIRTIAKHSDALAQKCVDAKALDPLVKCLEQDNSKVREAAAWALGFIASHKPELAQAVVNANSIQSLITAVQEPELSLKRIAVCTLGDIAKHNPELAQCVIDARAIPTIAPLLKDSDAKLKQQVCTTLAHIAKHSVDSAELVVEAEIFPAAMNCLRDKDAGVRKAASVLIRQTVSHTIELAQLVIRFDGAAALVDFLKPEQQNEPLHAVIAIGYIATYSQALATSLIQANAPSAVLNVFTTTKNESTQAMAAWALGQLGSHSPENAAKLASLNVLSLLLEAHNSKGASDDLKLRTKRALKVLIQQCNEIEALQPLIEPAPENILKHVLEQISKLLPKNPKMRVPFVTSGGFQAVQKIPAQPGTKIRDYIDAINAVFPEQAVHFYSPKYPDTLLQEIDNYEG